MRKMYLRKMHLHHEIIEDMQDLGMFSGSVDSGLGPKLLKIGEVKMTGRL